MNNYSSKNKKNLKNSDNELLKKINFIENNITTICGQFEEIIPNIKKIKLQINKKENKKVDLKENNNISNYLNEFKENIKKDLEIYKSELKEEITKELKTKEENIEDIVKKLVKQELDKNKTNKVIKKWGKKLIKKTRKFKKNN